LLEGIKQALVTLPRIIQVLMDWIWKLMLFPLL